MTEHKKQQALSEFTLEESLNPGSPNYGLPLTVSRVPIQVQPKTLFVYLPANGRLMKPEVMDRIGDAGVAACNLALDCIEEKPGLPKALKPIRPCFVCLIEDQRRCACTVSRTLALHAKSWRM